MNKLAARIAALTPQQRALFLARRKRVGEKRSVTIPRRSGDGPWPASVDQTALWFFHQLDPQTTAYNIGRGVRLRGNVKAQVLERSFNEVLNRHEILRTTFREEDGKLYQVVAPSLDLQIPLIDLRTLKNGEKAALREASRCFKVPFDLERGPLIGLYLMQIADADYVLVTSLHHNITDWWSFQVFFRELFGIYQAFSQGRPSPLVEPPTQFVDYAIWRNRWLETPDFVKQLDYWVGKLEGAPAALEFRGDRPRPPVASRRGAQEYFDVPIEVLDGLHALNRQAGTTSLMTLLAATFVFLYRYTGEEDIVLGMTIANRDAEETKSLLGYLLNPVAMRTDLGGSPSFLEVSRRVKELVLEALANKDLPFRLLVEKLSPERDLSRMPVYQVEYVYVSAEGLNFTDSSALQVALQELDFTIDNCPVDRRSSPVDLQIAFTETTDYLELMVEYSVDLFDRVTVRRMGKMLLVLLQGLFRAPEVSISEISLLEDDDRRRMLELGRSDAVPHLSPGAPRCRHQLLHRFFEEQARSTPERTAVLWPIPNGAEIETVIAISYAALESRANKVARCLRGYGIEPEVGVGLLASRSLEMIIGIYGILKAGAAFVPLDPASPPRRLEELLEDSGVELILTESHLLRLLTGTELPFLCLDRPSDFTRQRALGGRVAEPTAGNAAYMLYTSGSTGRPKGVVVTHRSAAAFVEWGNGVLPQEQLRRVLASISISFDMSLTELFLPLAAGGDLLLVENLLETPELPAAAGPSMVVATPSILGALLADHGLPESVSTVWVGGEAFPSSLAQRLHEKKDVEFVVNAYGPTEATVNTVVGFVPRGHTGPVLIGRPIPGTETFLLDGSFEPVPTDVAGELYLGGCALARGYHRRAALTAQSFVPDAFGGEAGARLYRTGDLCRYREGGEIEYLGRIDRQLKLRGYRIEPGEIESTLRQHRTVQATVVVVRRGETGGDKLVAFIVPRGQAGDPVESAEQVVSELRSYLVERLPLSMIPEHFVAVPQLPLTRSGKVDLGALPSLRLSPETAEPVAPRSQTERTLARIWSQVLRRDRIGVHDNFFQLGGDSILSIQVVTRCRREGLLLTPRKVFEHQTIAGLAAAVVRAEKSSAEQGPVTGGVALTPIQHWFFELGLVEPARFHQALVFEVKRPVRREVLRRALSFVCAHHDALRLRFEKADSGWRQRCEPPTAQRLFRLIQVDLEGLSAVARERARETLVVEIWKGMDIERGPLVTVVLCELGPVQHVLIGIQHLVIDASSWLFLLEDLETACEQITVGREPKLAPKTTSFKAWAEVLSGRAQSEEVLSELPFWLTAATRRTAALPLARAGDGKAAKETLTVSFSREETELVLRDIHAAYKTRVEDVLLAALVQAVGRETGRFAVRLELERDSREENLGDMDASRTVGWFTSIFPVVLELAGSEPAGEALMSIKEQLRRIPHHGVHYGLLRFSNGSTRERLRGLRAGLFFGYLGQRSSTHTPRGLFRLAGTAKPAAAAPAHNGPYELEIYAQVSSGRLRIDWIYTARGPNRRFVSSLAEQTERALHGLVEHCLSPSAGGRTPSDFPLAGLNRRGLDRLTGRYGEFHDVYPLTPMQQGLLFHSDYAPDAGVYCEQRVYRFRGPLEVAVLRSACKLLVDRHAILRTIFASGGDSALQVVLRRHPLEWSEVDWTGLDRTGPDRGEPALSAGRVRLERVLDDDVRRGFEPAVRPPVRLILIRNRPQDFLLVWSYHHVLLDGWSLPILMLELADAYEALRTSREPEWIQAPPFRDYVAWLQRQETTEAEDFWRRMLLGFTAPLRLFPASDGKGSRPLHEAEQILLSAEVTASLGAFGRQWGLTLNTLVEGAWAILLGSYCGSSDVVFGVTGAGRPPDLAGSERMVGLLLRSYPLRADIASRQSLSSWLAELQSLGLEASQHESVPLVEIQRLSEVPAGQPLFESLVVFQNLPIDHALEGGWPGFQIGELRKLEKTHYPLTLLAIPGEELLLKLSYRLDRWTRAAASRFLNHLAALLKALPAHSEREPGNLEFLTAAEHHQLSVEWNDTWRPRSPPRRVDELFEDQVVDIPDAVAVSQEVPAGSSTRLTYRDLDRRASRLATRLRRVGVRPETLVGVAVEPGPGLLVVLLAIFRAGGAYLPLEPSHPRQRLAFLLADSRASILVTRQRWRPRFSDFEGPVLVLEQEWVELAGGEHFPERTATWPGSLAYVIYTSGSTGRPKGVQVSHGALTEFLRSMSEQPGFGKRDRLLCATPLSFDISALELFLPLIVGAELETVSRETAKDGDGLRLRLPSATILQATPATWRLLLAAGWERSDGPLRALCGGEALPVPLAVEIAERAVAAWNMYGPTETTIFSSVEKLGEGAASPGASVPIGRPIAKTVFYVVNEAQRRQPISVPGELQIGGAGLARGYRNRPGLTAARFVPDPFGATPGARLYRTGDRARWVPDGRVEFLGRQDNQVKLRGFRIELGEIEAVLGQHPRVEECVALAREDPASSGDRWLVAYVSPRGDGALDRSALRDYLGKRLPAYMVPSLFVTLESFPLNSNGKVDRAALLRLALPAGRGAEPSSYVAPRSQGEELLAGIWSELLGAERAAPGRVGIHDSFFELGGHSLVATRVMSRVRQAFGVDLPLRLLFEAPTIADLAAGIATARGVKTTPSRGWEIARLPNRQRAPLSFAQDRLWFLDQLAPSSVAYNLPQAVRLRGSLKLGALSWALTEVLRRHEVLRTVYESDDGMPWQVVRQSSRNSLPEVDLSALGARDRESCLRRLVAAEAGRPFDLSRDRMLRGTVLRLGAEDHALLLTLHHIASDGWSLGILTRELGALYRSALSGEASPLPALRVQYADFAEWQREWLSGDRLSDEVSWWRDRLAGVPAVLDLPTDRPRPAVWSDRGSSESMWFRAPVASSLRALGRCQGATDFMTLLAVLQLLLFRYSGREHLAVGTPISGRNRLEIEPLVGFFVNTLVLAGDLSGDPSFLELLSRVRETALEAHEHQDLPFEKLVEELEPERSLLHSPLFQVLLAFQNVPQEEAMLEGLRAEPLGARSETAKFDLSLSLVQGGDSLRVTLEYSRALFDPTTAKRLLKHFERLMAVATEDPEQRIRDLPMLSVAEHRQVLTEWHFPAPGDQPVFPHQLVKLQAEQTPAAVAVSFGRKSLTYQRLWQRADSLAGHLRYLGVGSESLVGICAERSLEMVIAVLAVLEAGGAYLPLDPTYPRRRLAFMLEDSRVSVLLTQQQLAGSLPEFSGEVVFLDRESSEPRTSAAPGMQVSADQLAYVIYTSGSTGHPKGVAMRYGTLARLVAWQLASLQGAPKPRTLQFASLSFDVSFQEIFTTLAAGGTLVLISEEVRRDATLLLRALEERLVERLFLPFVALVQLAEVAEGTAVVPQSLREVITAGEQLRLTAPIRRWMDRLPKGALFNQYGPSETHVVTSWRLQGRAADGPVLPPIGRPIAGARIYVLKRGLTPTPIGVPGELYLGGEAIGRGYLGRPGWTAERFVPDLFATEPGARLYRSGDLGRWLPNYNLEFLGRGDHQVKIRGFRIEPGEIEAVLDRHPQVREAAVVVSQVIDGDPRLIAFLLAPGASSAQLRQFLGQRLPDYMVPSLFINLEALPLTSSGKVNRAQLSRRALPDVERTGTSATDAPGTDAPGNPRQELLADIFSGLLGIEGVGAHDNFFDLGGHSLIATQVMSRIRSVFAVEVPLRALFEAPTVAGLSDTIERARRSESAVLAPPIEPLERRPENLQPGLRLSFAQQRLWFLDQLDPGSSTYNIPWAVRIVGVLELAVLERCLNEIVRRHEALRTVFATTRGEPVQHIRPVVSFDLPVVDLSALSPAVRSTQAKGLRRAEALRPFDLAQGPLLRGCGLRLGPQEHIVLLTMHHAVSDGWSIGILNRELATLYQAFQRDEPSSLPELPVQYADFALWQRRWLRGKVLENELEYWRRQLEDIPPELTLPSDRPRPPIRDSLGWHRSADLQEPLTEGLRRLSRSCGTTLFMTALAAFQALLARCSGELDINVGTPIAGRNRLEIEDLIGFFVNTLVLRTRLEPQEGFTAVLGRVREVVLEAHTHQNLPFEQLVKELQPERSLSHSPLFQVMFSMTELDHQQPMPQSAGLDMQTLEPESETVKFDLELSLLDDGSQLRGLMHYATDLFDATTIRRFLEHYRVLLEEIVAKPDRSLWSLPLFGAAERSQLLWEWSTGRLLSSEACSVIELFWKKVEQNPSHLAVCAEGTAWSYHELGERVRTLARCLASRTADQPGERLVGLMMNSGPGSLVAMLGILESGCGFVPLDLRYPESRLAQVMAECELATVVAERASEHAALRLLDPAPGALVLVDAMPADGEAAHPRPVSVPRVYDPGQVAYVIYTSGSTGRPKGVPIVHRTLGPAILSSCDDFGLGEHTRVLQSLSHAFDFGVLEVLTTVAAGGTLYFLAPEELMDPVLYAGAVAKYGINTIHCTPSFISAMVAGGARFPNLEVLDLGGEALTWEGLEPVFRAVGENTMFFNGYGPTEATITATVLALDRSSTLPRQGPVPIGRPSTNHCVYVVDHTGYLLPMGVAGELWVGGDLARGYHLRPGLTAEKFVPDPWSGRSGSRLYRTGDLVRFLSVGELEFLGRIDHQIKIRGFRIEVGEIEASLRSLPAVREAVVVAWSLAGDLRLAAYVVPEKGAELMAEKLREELRGLLPAYMLPRTFSVLDELPLTPSGKIDRRVLPTPEEKDLPAMGLAPRDQTELDLARIWGEILGRDRIGVQLNFFEMGGHSLNVVQLTSRIEEQFEVRLPLTALFQAPTIETQARLLQQPTGVPPQGALVKIQPDGSRHPVFFVHPVGGNVFCYAALSLRLGNDQPFYGLAARGLHGESPRNSIEAMASAYVAELLAFQPDGSYQLGGWSMGGVIAFEMARQLEAQGRPIKLIAMLDSHAPGAYGASYPSDELAMFAAFAQDLGLGEQARVAVPVKLQDLSRDELLQWVHRQALSAGLLPPHFDRLRLGLFYDVFRANVRALQAYSAEATPISGPIHLFRAADGSSRESAGPDLGWKPFAIGVQVEEVPGDHFTALREPELGVFAEKLEHLLAIPRKAG